MLLPQPMAHGRLVSRYKRFFADVMLDDGVALTAHCPNPGAMLGLNAPGLGVWLSKSDAPKRKLAWTLELVEDGGGLAGVNTMNPNKLVAEALAGDAMPELAGYAVHRREVKFGEAKPGIDKEAGGKASVNATFSAPGWYILRVEANDSAGVGGGGFQCCGTNAHVAVSVRPAAGMGGHE